ncbi:Non-specific lipid-transfer protein 2 [Ananas comosus]|uniref:Non-specific lipid-transfer protein n=1 Tax=Ananas comosus TaxID=4615 RepID=A0A199W3B7_ANACO|nr:Non-specific lipid-transfer protein 2 [Ananas comosus]
MAHIILGFILVSAAASRAVAAPPPCSEVAQMVSPCVPYLAGRAWAPFGPCCGGVAALNQTVATDGDREIVCNCLRSVAPRFPMIDVRRAAVLPRLCGVAVNVTIAPGVDCSRLENFRQQTNIF